MSFTSQLIQAQSKLTLVDKNAIVEHAERELDAAFTPPDGELFRQIAMYPPSETTYIFDITIRHKGEIVTVFSVNNGEGNIAIRNKLETILRTYKLSFKMPKKNRYKFQYKIHY